MSCTRSEILGVARSWIGKNEADGSHKMIIDLYNSHKPLARGYKVKYTDAWCMPTVTALAIACNATDIIPKECGVERAIRLAKEMGIWVENDAYIPTPGDFICYNWQDNDNFATTDNTGWADHIGIVDEVTAGNVIPIEGNFRNKVCRTSVKINGRNIRGYIVPKYDAEKVVAPTPAPTRDYLMKGDTGKEVKQMQEDLIYVGYSCGRYGADGDFGNDTDEALKLFQCDYGLNVNGKYDPASKAKLTELVAKKKNSVYYPKYTGTSNAINTVFKAIGVPDKYCGKWSNRIPVAKANGINNYTGTYEQNIKLASLAKQGKLKKVG